MLKYNPETEYDEHSKVTFMWEGNHQSLKQSHTDFRQKTQQNVKSFFHL